MQIILTRIIQQMIQGGKIMQMMMLTSMFCENL